MSYSGSTELLLITFMDTHWLSSMYYCNSWKRVLNYGPLLLDWQTECPFWTLTVQMFMSFNECLFGSIHFGHLPGTLFFTLIWSPALVAVFIIPCVAEDHYSRLVLEIIKASSYWKRDVCNSLWIESVKNEFLFTDWPNRPLDTSGCLEI